MRHETDRLRALNVPQRVQVELDEQRRPRVVMREPGNVKRVESLGENWRMDDEWWRQPIVRRYVEVVLEGGGRVVLVQDLITGELFLPTLCLGNDNGTPRLCALSFLDGASRPKQ